MKPFPEWLEDNIGLAGFKGPKANAEFCVAAGISRSTLGRIMTEPDSTPEILTVKGIARALRIPVPVVMVAVGALEPEDLRVPTTAVPAPPDASALAWRPGRSPAEHKMLCEQLLARMEKLGSGVPLEMRDRLLRLAQVHATLATIPWTPEGA